MSEADVTEATEVVEEAVGEPVVAVPTVGQQLRAAREAAGLSVVDVAQTLKYGARQVELLEQDNHAALPGNTVVRGFVRSYAKFLKLDAAVLLKQLDDRAPVVPADVRAPENMGVAGADGDKLQIGPTTSIAIVVLLAAVLLAGWHFFGPKPVPATHASAPKVETQVLPPSPASAPDAAPGSAPGVAEAAVPTLNFAFNGRSWLEVTDADGKLLHSAENPAGSQLSLSGKPPFELVVGNAAQVKLSYGERAIDLAPYTRAEVARLKVE